MGEPMGKACLTCDHCVFTAPTDWKPSYSGEEFDKYCARNMIKETELHLNARCSFNPVWIDVNTGHYCGQWHGAAHHHDVDEFIHGSWASSQLEGFKDEVKALRASLKKARRISASRH